MLDQIRALIVEAIGDGVTVQVKPSKVRKMVVLTDADDDSAVYLDGVLCRVVATNILADVMAEVANGLAVVIVHRRLDYSVTLWGDKLREVIKVSIMPGESHHNGLALKSECNNKDGCFEDSFVELEKEWVPKPNEWVRLQDGTVRQHIGYEIHGTRKYYRFDGMTTRFELGTLEPWTPKVGDWVKVNKAAEASGIRWLSPCMDCFDGAVVRISSFMFQEPLQFRADGVDGFVFSVDWVEPAVPPKEAPANPSATSNSSKGDPLNCIGEVCDSAEPIDVKGCCTLAIFDGWRELEPDEIPKPGDLRECDGAWKVRTSVSNHEYESHQSFHIRKIETAKEPEYREPTYADLANGPIEVEVNDDERDESAWVKRMLYAVLPANVRIRFVCEFPVEKGSIHRWKHARIKVC